jgi:predicted peptidase
MPRRPGCGVRRGWTEAVHLSLGGLAAALLLVCSPHALAAQAAETGFLNRNVEVGGRSYRYQVYVPPSYNASQRWPVILFLHGGGERGTDGLLQTQVGLGAALRKDAERFPAVVVFPQVPPDSFWVGTPARVAMAALDRTVEEFRTDPDRVYLTGLSIGGNGTWYLAYRHPSRFAALMPICGWVIPDKEWKLPAELVVPPDSGPPYAALARRLRNIPTWIVHGEVDDVIPVEHSRLPAAALRAAGAPVQYLELVGTEHNSWDPAYASPKMMEWLLAQRRRPDRSKP